MYVLCIMELTIDGGIYRLTDMDTRSLCSDETDKTGPLLCIMMHQKKVILKFCELRDYLPF